MDPTWAIHKGPRVIPIRQTKIIISQIMKNTERSLMNCMRFCPSLVASIVTVARLIGEGKFPYCSHPDCVGVEWRGLIATGI